MKSVFLAVLLCRFITTAYTQVSVTVDAGQVLKILNGYENGVNLDYLMDGSYLNPAVPLSTSLKNMGAKLLRYPGGEKSDNYLWSAAPWAAASPRMALTDAVACWPTDDARFVDQASAEKMCKPAVLDFDELMTVCHATGAQPLIVVAYDAMYNTATTLRPTRQQLIENAVAWVRYANITKGFGIKYWMIGNESWNLPDYNGRATPAQYAADLIDFASAMKAVDPTIKIIANGRSNWWQTLLQSSAVSLIDILAFSSYPVYNFTAGYETYRQSNVNLTYEVNAAVKAINKYAPAADRARLKVLAAEYNSMDWSGNWNADNDLGHALCNFQMFGDMVVNPKVEGACLWNTRWTDNETAGQHIYDALDKDGGLNATGLAQQVWGKNLLQTMVAASSTNAQVKAYATYDTATQDLNIFLLNKDTAAKAVNLAITNYVSEYGGSKFVFSGTSVSDKFPLFSWAGAISSPADAETLELPPASVTVLKLLGSFVYLPVKVHSFSGAVSGANIRLTWRGENETDLLHYVIERKSQNNRFDSIGVQLMAHQETASAGYASTDSAALLHQASDYRIKAVTQSGTICYSSIVNFTPKAPRFSVFIAPNPVQDQLQLHITTIMPQAATLNITDRGGRVWGFEKVHLEAGTNVVQVASVRTLQHGVYWLQVQANGQQKTLPFLKQ